MAQHLTGDPRDFYTKKDKMFGIKRNVSELLVRPRLVDGILMEIKVKSIKVDRIKVKVYQNWYI